MRVQGAAGQPWTETGEGTARGRLGGSRPHGRPAALLAAPGPERLPGLPLALAPAPVPARALFPALLGWAPPGVVLCSSELGSPPGFGCVPLSTASAPTRF